jgi:hypothetical protein
LCPDNDHPEAAKTPAGDAAQGAQGGQGLAASRQYEALKTYLALTEGPIPHMGYFIKDAKSLAEFPQPSQGNSVTPGHDTSPADLTGLPKQPTCCFKARKRVLWSPEVRVCFSEIRQKDAFVSP